VPDAPVPLCHEVIRSPDLAVAPKPRVAIVLFNLGGPDSLESVRPFLINLFTDPAILRVPFFIRPFLSRFIAWRRIKPATENYRLMGGKSPLLELTQAQAAALQTALPDIEARCFVAMRYWHPFSLEAVRAVQDWNPDQVLLLPLYPHYSTTTTGSSLTAWRDAAARAGLAKPTRTLCCYPLDPAFVHATAEITRTCYLRAQTDNAAAHPARPIRILFSAHGLPQIIVDRGDPYRFQMEATAQAIADALAIPGLDWQLCFQSRATPQQWLEPSIEQELRRAAADQVGVLVVPIAFVSEHSETLVELDIEYGELAAHLGIPGYHRAPAQNSDPGFIAALAGMVRRRLAQPVGTCSHAGGRICPDRFVDCPLRPAA
jgi:ferrochelatase